MKRPLGVLLVLAALGLGGLAAAGCAGTINGASQAPAPAKGAGGGY
jgi:hypothetical protein